MDYVEYVEYEEGKSYQAMFDTTKMRRRMQRKKTAASNKRLWKMMYPKKSKPQKLSLADEMRADAVLIEKARRGKKRTREEEEGMEMAEKRRARVGKSAQEKERVQERKMQKAREKKRAQRRRRRRLVKKLIVRSEKEITTARAYIDDHARAIKLAEGVTGFIDQSDEQFGSGPRSMFQMSVNRMEQGLLSLQEEEEMAERREDWIEEEYQETCSKLNHVNEKYEAAWENVYLNEKPTCTNILQKWYRMGINLNDVGYYTNAELVVFIKLALSNLRKGASLVPDKMKKHIANAMQCRLRGDNDDAQELCHLLSILDIAHEF
jgi:hypothetical protein